jgi:Gram-negative bacterial TonB protein C-terminal
VPTPPELKSTRASGKVILYVLISQTGAVTDVEPIFASSPALADYATQLAKGYTYKPILRHDKPLEEIAHAWFDFKF